MINGKLEVIKHKKPELNWQWLRFGIIIANKKLHKQVRNHRFGGQRCCAYVWDYGYMKTIDINGLVGANRMVMNPKHVILY